MERKDVIDGVMGAAVIIGIIVGLFLIVRAIFSCLTIMLMVPDDPSILDAPANAGTKQPVRPTSVPTYSPVDARSACEIYVSASLKSPSTVRFLHKIEEVYNITGKPKNYFLIVGAVDAQNSFGATLRIWYECQVHYDTKLKDWVLDYLEFEK